MSVVKCAFCGRLFEGNKFEDDACPLCVREAKRNSQPYPPEKQKKFVESDGFFDEKEFLQEDKKQGFFESSEYHNPNPKS